MDKKVVLTGASGHIGFHVANQLLELGFRITLLIRSTNRNILLLKEKGAEIVSVNLMEPPTYQNYLSNADVLFHLASENTTDTSDEKRVIEHTFALSKKVIDTAIEQNVKTIIYTSSVVVLGRSANSKKIIDENGKADFLESPYVKGKFYAEQYCEELITQKRVYIRRVYPAWAVGNHDQKLTPPHKIIKDYLQKGQVFYFSGGISIASVEEIAKGHVNAWLQGKAHEQYVLGGNNVSFKEFYSTLARLSGKKPPFLFIPKWIIYCGSIAAKLLLGKKSPVDPKYVKSVIGNYSWYSSAKAVKELSYKIPSTAAILKIAVDDAVRKQLGTDLIISRNNHNLKRINYESDDVLLITGFPGWLGNRMVDIFLNGDRFGNNALNRRVRLLVQPRYKNYVSLPSSFEIVYGDITDKQSLSAALKDVKAVYHLAGVIYPKNIDSFYKVNYEGTKNLVDACIEKRIRRILFMGTDSICGFARNKKMFSQDEAPHPYKNYGKSKYLAEHYIFEKTKEGLIDGTSLRGFWFFGPFMPERNLNFFKMFYWKRQLVFGNGKNYRSISHVDTIVQAFVKAEKKKETFGNWYWIGDKKADRTVDEIYQHIADGLGVKYNPVHIPNFVCEFFSLADSFLGIFGKLNPTIHAAGKFHKNIAGEISAAEKDFDFKADVDFEEIKKEIRDFVTH